MGAGAYGAAGYLVYAVNDWLLLGLREEVFRDNTGFFAGSFAANDNFIDIERGKTNNIDPRTFFSAGTFDEVTVGATFKLPLWKRPGGLMIRPELRYDAALSSNATPYSNRDSSHQFTVGIDAIFNFQDRPPLRRSAAIPHEMGERDQRARGLAEDSAREIGTVAG